LLIIFMSGLDFWQNVVFGGTFLLSYGLIRKKVYTGVLILIVILSSIFMRYVGFDF